MHQNTQRCLRGWFDFGFVAFDLGKWEYGIETSCCETKHTIFLLSTGEQHKMLNTKVKQYGK